MSFKHNKKRNTAFLFEVMVREVSEQILEENKSRREHLLELIKKYFGKDSILAEELQLYRDIYEDNSVTTNTLQNIVLESKRKFDKINKKNVFNKQTKLISEINKIDKNIFNNFIKNYKVLASINQYFLEESLGSKEMVSLKEQIVEFVIDEPEQSNGVLEEVDSIVYRTFIDKFNNEYAELLSEQKELLQLYVLSSSKDGKLSFACYLNEEIARLKQEVSSSFELKEIKEDLYMKEKAETVIVMLEEFSTREIQENDFEKILMIQELVREINTDADQDNSAQ